MEVNLADLFMALLGGCIALFGVGIMTEKLPGKEWMRLANGKTVLFCGIALMVVYLLKAFYLL